MSLTARAIAIALLVAALLAGWWRLTSYYDHRGYTRAKAEDTAAMQAQAERNRELQRRSEQRYTVQAEARDRFIVTTVREIRHATDNLRACVLSPDARRLFNDAAACARGDSAAACGAGEPVPDAR